LLSGGFKLN